LIIAASAGIGARRVGGFQFKKCELKANGGGAMCRGNSESGALMNDPEIWALFGFGIAAVYALGVFVKISKLS
jgi:hypothetical protein